MEELWLYSSRSDWILERERILHYVLQCTRALSTTVPLLQNAKQSDVGGRVVFLSLSFFCPTPGTTYYHLLLVYHR